LVTMGRTLALTASASSLIGCSDNNNSLPEGGSLPDADHSFLETTSTLREIAWNQLSEQEKSSVIGDWHEAEVTIVRWRDVPLKQTKAAPEVIYKVTFNTELDARLGPHGVYFDPTTKTIVGYDVRE
jgi:hypothetical protein